MMMYYLKLQSASISSATFRLHRVITVNLKINNKMLLFFCSDEGLASAFLCTTPKSELRGGLRCELICISINLLVVYRESVNLIGYITRTLSAESQQL